MLPFMIHLPRSGSSIVSKSLIAGLESSGVRGTVGMWTLVWLLDGLSVGSDWFRESLGDTAMYAS